MRGIGIIRSGFGLWYPMPEIFLEFIGDASPWLVPLLVVLAVWGKFNWAALNNPDKKASFERAVGWLREDSFGHLYLGFLGGLMDRVGSWIGDRRQLSQDSMVMTPPKGLTQRMFGFNPFTAESYEKCLWLAFMYPVFAYLIAWAMGADGQVGNVSLFGIADIKLSPWQHWALVTSIFLLISFALLLRQQGWKRWFKLTGLLLIILSSIQLLKSEAGPVFLALGGAVAVAFTVTKAANGHGTPVVIGSLASFLIIADISAFFGLVTTSVIVMGVLSKIEQSEKGLIWLVYSTWLIVAGIILLAAEVEVDFNSNHMLLVLLWLLLPLTNAPLDWLSLGFTRGLLQAVRTGNHSGWRALTWASADLLLAFIFMFLITAVLVGVTALGNAVAGKTLVDIGCIFSNLKADSADPDHWWIYFMLLSTLVPTLFHFALAGGAATLWLPRKWRTQLADGLEEDIHKTFGAWVYLTFTPVIGFILMPLALLWSLWWLLNINGGALGTLLLNWATGLAQWADPAMMLSCSAG